MNTFVEVISAPPGWLHVGAIVLLALSGLRLSERAAPLWLAAGVPLLSILVVLTAYLSASPLTMVGAFGLAVTFAAGATVGWVSVPTESVLVDPSHGLILLPFQVRTPLFVGLQLSALFYLFWASGTEMVAGRQTPDQILALGLATLLAGLFAGEGSGFLRKFRKGPWVELG